MEEFLPLDLLGVPFVLFVLLFQPLWKILAVIIALYLLFIISNRSKKGTTTLLIRSLFLGGLMAVAYLTRDIHTLRVEQSVFEQATWSLAGVLYFAFLKGKDYYHILRGAKAQGDCCAKCKTLHIYYMHYRKMLSIYALFIVIALTALSHSAFQLEIAKVLNYLTAIISLVICIIFTIHILYVKHYLQKENLVPILDKDFQVKRLVAESCIPSVKEEGIIPIVRLISFSKGMIYLEFNDEEQSYDSPFHSYQYAKSKPRAIAQQMILSRFCGFDKAEPRALINYMFGKDNSTLLIHLFVIELDSPEQLFIDCKPIEGKWWHIEELESLIPQGLLSLELTEEYSYLKETILLAKKLHHRKNTTEQN